jgi:hypothetical protein
MAKLEIPEWTGSSLTVGAFDNFAGSVLAAFVKQGFTMLHLQDIGPELQAAVTRLSEFINRQRAYDETPEVAKADGNRDALWKAFYHAWSYLMQLDPSHPLYAHALTLRSEMTPYKGVDRHEISKETTELKGLLRDLDNDDNGRALEALGLTNIVSALSVANQTVEAAISARDTERGSRAAEKGGDTTPSLRKAVVVKLIEAYRQVNAAVRIVPMPEIEQAIQDVCGIIEHYKLVASEAKHRKGDEPEPGPEPEPNGGAAAS